MNNNPEFDVVISDAALAMLDSHMNFLANVSATAAKKLLGEILDDIASLSEHPMRFPIYQNQFIAESRYRRMLSAKRYLVIYEIDRSTVFVDFIVDCRQDFEWMIR